MDIYRRIKSLSHGDTSIDHMVVLMLAISTAVCMKLFYLDADPEDLRWILLPTTSVVEAFSGIGFNFEPARGYLATGMPVLIGKGCAGINYFVIALCMATFSLTHRVKRHKVLAFLGLVLATYFVTVFVNAFRIMGGLALLELGRTMEFTVTGLMHEAQGAMVYFTFLVMYYLALSAYMNRRSRNEDV